MRYVEEGAFVWEISSLEVIEVESRRGRDSLGGFASTDHSASKTSENRVSTVSSYLFI